MVPVVGVVEEYVAHSDWTLLTLTPVCIGLYILLYIVMPNYVRRHVHTVGCEYCCCVVVVSASW